MNGLDLHVHSDLSDDGEWSAERIVGEAFRLGIGTLAIADHNRTRAVVPRASRCSISPANSHDTVASPQCGWGATSIPPVAATSSGP